MCVALPLRPCPLFATRAGSPGALAAPAVPPSAKDKDLQRIVADLYDGTTNPKRVGDGTTWAAIENEIATNQATHGIWHMDKGRQSMNRIINWLRDHPGADAADDDIAAFLLRSLAEAFGD